MAPFAVGQSGFGGMAQGTLRTPRDAPRQDVRVQKTAGVLTLNDEVAQILKGLKMEKAFFAERIRREPLSELAPMAPPDMLLTENASRADRKRDSIKRNRKRFTIIGMVEKKHRDFDIYLTESVFPVLAQALDSLCRQVGRMNEQGDALDPKIRARFNPLNWLGQQLLRRHPKYARTPRRQSLYKNFKDWADWEKGRRAMLRRREEVNEVFNGFLRRGSVAYENLWGVVEAVDDSLKLDGRIKGHPEMRMAFENGGALGGNNQMKQRFVAGAQWGFDEFWYFFGNTVMKHDLVPHSLLLRGDAIKAKDLEEQTAWMDKRAEAEAEEVRLQEEKRRLMAQYSELHGKFSADPHIVSMMTGGKILTGDDVRPNDIGYEFEVPPHGSHITLLADLLYLLGFEEAKAKDAPMPDASAESAVVGEKAHGFLRAAAHAQQIKGAHEEERYWDDDLAHAWAMLQKVHHVEVCDGVVDGEVLSQVLVAPVGFGMLRAKVEYELERKAERGDESEQADSPRIDLSLEVKPTMEQLAQRLGMSMSRLQWLHGLFESFLKKEDGQPPPCCMYPECPASLDKDAMRSLVHEVEPNLSRAQFDARFKRLDRDGSGLIEFDEFAYWVHSSDVRIAGAKSVKMIFEEIAYRYQEPVELVRFLHSCFQDQLPDGVVDGYPLEPVGLAKQEAKFLAGIITPGFDAEEFEQNFSIVDQGSRQPGFCDFDEFVEMLELDDLPAELRDRFEAN